MTRKTFENIFLALLIVVICSIVLYNYHFNRKKFINVADFSFTNRAQTVQLNAKKINKFDINSISFDKLNSLPGVSSNIAADIISYREKHKFKNIAELAFIKGIGEKKLAALTDYLECK